jgi:hypothetical protein
VGMEGDCRAPPNTRSTITSQHKQRHRLMRRQRLGTESAEWKGTRNVGNYSRNPSIKCHGNSFFFLLWFVLVARQGGKKEGPECGLDFWWDFMHHRLLPGEGERGEWLMLTTHLSIPPLFLCCDIGFHYHDLPPNIISSWAVVYSCTRFQSSLPLL